MTGKSSSNFGGLVLLRNGSAVGACTEKRNDDSQGLMDRMLTSAQKGKADGC